MRVTVRAALDCLDALPPFPPVLSRLITSLSRADTSLEDIAAIVHEDPLLAARVLRLANSPAHAGRMPTRTVRDALLRLGTLEVRRLAMVLSAATALPVREGSASYRHFWQHSLAVARLASVVASRSPARPADAHVESAFLAGLFHDVGLLALVNHYPTFMAEVERLARTQTSPLHEAELVVLGVDHGELGALVAEHWSLPADVVEPVRGHHRLELAAEEYRWSAAAVHLADWLMGEKGLGDLADAFPVDADERALPWLGLGEADLAVLRDLAAVEAGRGDVASAE